MPAIGGRLGWNEPPPAAITITLTSNTLPRSVVTRNSRIADALDRLHHLAEMEGRAERLDLLHQRVGEPLAGDVGNAGNVVDRLLRIELGALAADLVEDVDQVRLHVEQAELEHREQADRPGADDERVGLDRPPGPCVSSSSHSLTWHCARLVRRVPFRFMPPGLL